jgi:hypothetical protein
LQQRHCADASRGTMPVLSREDAQRQQAQQAVPTSMLHTIRLAIASLSLTGVHRYGDAYPTGGSSDQFGSFEYWFTYAQ